MIKVIKSILKSALGRGFLSFVEWLIFGGRHRRAFLEYILALFYRSKFRRDWVWSVTPPHFTDFERYEAILKDPGNSAYIFYRGMLTMEVLRPGDSLLDIGCGGGFFVYRFYSHKCKNIDAIDIEKSAIDYARNYNSSSNVRYVLQDAVNVEFPSKNYDVIAWDGALGHFSAEVTDTMLKKISKALSGGGVFVGSESLGHEGHDHLQFFDSQMDLAILLKKYFQQVSIREATYPIGYGFIRREAYWRCGNSENFSDRTGWVSF